MGLDTVEFVMDVEDTFGIKIDDEAYATILSPRDLAHYICRQLTKQNRLLDDQRDRPHSPGTSWTKTPEFLAWSLLKETFPPPAVRLRPSTPLDTLLPSQRRRQLWEKWQIRAGVKFPVLISRSGAAVLLLLIIALMLVWPAYVIGSWLGLIVFGLIIANFAYVVHCLDTAVASTNLQFPACCTTVGELARCTIPENEEPRITRKTLTHWAERGGPRPSSWPQATVEPRVMALLWENMSIQPGDVQPTDLFTDIFY